MHAGDRVKVSLQKAPSLDGPLRGWTADRITVGPTAAARAEVVQVERYRPGTWSRGKRALVGAAIGGAAGAAIGIIPNNGCTNSFGPCFTRAQTGAAVGATGAVVGALIGALLPHHRWDVIYRASH